jgi:hypothetical protein
VRFLNGPFQMAPPCGKWIVVIITMPKVFCHGGILNLVSRVEGSTILVIISDHFIDLVRVSFGLKVNNIVDWVEVCSCGMLFGAKGEMVMT